MSKFVNEIKEICKKNKKVEKTYLHKAKILHFLIKIHCTCG